jgi:molybdopterin/thiamine biosynthesis adenylyltransferase
MKNSVFTYPDTNSARAKIEIINQRFEGLRIGIVGLGGTGSYILDLVAKTPVKEIHLYDGDTYQVHNAFRAPGATSAAMFESKDVLYKVDHFYEIYKQLHSGIAAHNVFITSENVNDLFSLDFVFLSVDKNNIRRLVTKALIEKSIPFIDVGLGVNTVENQLVGTLRVTKGTEEKNDHLSNRIGLDEFAEDEYSTNIQIADLNCLNAALAVIAWKKLVGFYQDLKKEHNQLYFINTGRLLNEDI